MKRVITLAAIAAALAGAASAQAASWPRFNYIDCTEFAQQYHAPGQSQIKKPRENTKDMYQFLCKRAAHAALSNLIGAEDYRKYVAASRDENIKYQIEEKGMSEDDARIYVSNWQDLQYAVFRGIRGEIPAQPVEMDCKKAADDYFNKTFTDYKTYSYAARMPKAEAMTRYALQCEDGLKAAANWNKTNWQVGETLKPMYEARTARLIAQGWSEKEARDAASTDSIGFIAGANAVRGSLTREIEGY